MLGLCCLIILVATILSGCATTGQTVPPHLLTCAPQPMSPPDPSQREVGLYVIDLAVAGDDCRTKLNAVRGIVQ
jgi:hypothetical protein